MKKRRRKARMTRRVMRLYGYILSANQSLISYSHRLPALLGNPRVFDRVGQAQQAQAATFAREWGGRDGVDVKRLEGIVVRGPDPMVVVRFAREIPGANIRRLTRAVVASGSPDAMRSMAEVPGVNRRYVLNALTVAEVLAG